MNLRVILFVLGFTLLSFLAEAQDNNSDSFYYHKTLSATEIQSTMKFLNDTDAYRYRQYVYYITTVWPYVLSGTQLMNEVDHGLSQNMDSKSRDKFISIKEMEFKTQFEDKIKNLNITQGKILVKLINRQLAERGDNTLYTEIVKLKGQAAAMKWQLWAKLNGMNLNEKYDKSKEIKLEAILRRLGYIPDEFILYY